MELKKLWANEVLKLFLTIICNELFTISNSFKFIQKISIFPVSFYLIRGDICSNTIWNFFIPNVTPKLWRSSSVCRTTIMFHLREERSQKTKQSPLKRRPHTLIRLSRRRRPKYTNSPQIFGLMRLLKNQGMTKNETRIPTSHLLGDVSSFLKECNCLYFSCCCCCSKKSH